ncbi:MAG: hypothetical protein LLG04_09825 [Parachlamydia sp.]|nr:hypothetical protein [Parachlamydia sp.]
MSIILNLYKVEDLPGEIFVQPLKGYQRFFANKIDQNSGMAKLALRIGQIVSGLILYPILGLIAGMGMLIKLTGIPGVYSENRQAKSLVNVIQTGIQAAKSFDHDSCHAIHSSCLRALIIREFHVTKQNADILCSSIQGQIDKLSKQFQKVYLQTYGRIDNGHGEIHLIFRIYRRI